MMNPSQIVKVVFERNQDIFTAWEFDWQATIHRADGSREVVYRRFLPKDHVLEGMDFYYAGHRAGRFTWITRRPHRKEAPPPDVQIHDEQVPIF